MPQPVDEAVLYQIRQGRKKFLAMAACYAMGVFNDNFFRQSTLLLAVAAGRMVFQERALILFSLPYLVFAAPAGWLADRFPKRRVIITTKLLELSAMVLGAVALCLPTDWSAPVAFGWELTVWQLWLAVVTIMGLQSCLFNPSLNGSIPELYPESYVTSANAKLKVATTGAIFIGVGLSGFALDVPALLRMEPGASLLGLPPGRLVVGTLAVMVAILGVVASLRVPTRPAADPRAPFPWDGPLRTLGDLWRLRTDKLLAVVVFMNAFIWFIGAVELHVINVLGEHQYGLLKWRTSTLVLAQLTGIAAGGVLSSFISRGRFWYRVLTPAAIGLGAAMASVALVPLLPDAAELPVLYLALLAAGALGGMILIPTAAFIQTRPKPGHRGAVLAASNFAAFTGIMLAGPCTKGCWTTSSPPRPSPSPGSWPCWWAGGSSPRCRRVRATC